MKGKKTPNRKKRLLSSLIIVFAMALLFAVFYSVPTFAAAKCGGADTAIISCSDDESGIWHMLNLGLDILSIGVGVLSVVGIILVGIQYLTSKDSADQSKKARTRISQIVIGVAIYATLFAVMQWLMPGGVFNPESGVGSGSQVEEVKNRQDAAREANAAKATADEFDYVYGNDENEDIKGVGNTSSSNTASNNTSSNSNTSGNNNTDENASWAEKIAQAAEELAWPLGTKQSKYHHNYPESTNFKSWDDLYAAKPNQAFMNAYDKVRPNHVFSTWSQMGADCGVFVTTVLRYSKHDSGKNRMKYGEADDYYSSSNKWKKVEKAQRGDVCTRHSNGSFHTRIYLGDGLVSEANHFGQNFGHLTKGNCKGYEIWRPL